MSDYNEFKAPPPSADPAQLAALLRQHKGKKAAEEPPRLTKRELELQKLREQDLKKKP